MKKTIWIVVICGAVLFGGCASRGTVSVGYNTYTAETQQLDRDSMGYIIRR
jgi:major membrane immunogen (membrane-anchored lipoprotein)